MAHYPRFGQKLAPIALAEILDTPSPRDLVGTKINDFPRLKDLDERVWHAFNKGVCSQLANVVVRNVQRGIRKLSPKALSHPLLPSGGALEIRPGDVEVRTANCWADLKKLKPDASQLTIADAISVFSLGAKTLVDLLTYIEAEGRLPARVGTLGIRSPSTEIISEANRLLAALNRWHIRADDPRLGHLIRAVDVTANDARELCEKLLRQPYEGAEHLAVEHLQELRRLVKKFQGIGLDAELAALLGQDRKGRMAMRYYGLDGKGGVTLQAVGDEFEVSRERVRQVVSRIAEGLQGKPFAPALDRALALVMSEIPAPAEMIESKLQNAGITKGTFRLEGLIEAAKLLGRKQAFVITTTGDRVAHSSSIESAEKIVQVARREISHWGVATVADIAAHVREIEPRLSGLGLVSSVVSREPGFRWLDDTTGWFWIMSVPRNSLLNRIKKVLSVSNPVAVSELRGAVGRDYRMQGFSPPSAILAEFCRQVDGLRVNGAEVYADPAIRPESVLSLNEKKITDVLTGANGVMRRTDLESACVERGTNLSTFYRYLSHSPVIAKYAIGVFGLVGADIQPGTVEALSPPRRKRKVLADYGWSPSGQIWLAYHLSDATVLSGVVSVPAAMREFVSGEFELTTPDQAKMGTLVARDGSAWGLGPFFKRRGGESGDYLVVNFDLTTRSATLRIGTASLVEEVDGADDQGVAPAGMRSGTPVPETQNRRTEEMQRSSVSGGKIKS